MLKKILSLFLCLISILFINNPAMAIEKNQTVIDNYKPEFTSYMNISSENSEPIYLARERRTKDGGTGEISWLWIGSIIIPGLGETLLGEVWRGLIFFIISLTGILIILFKVSSYADKTLFSIIYGLAIQLASTIDAFFIAKYKSEHSEDEARLLNEKLAQIEKALDKLSIQNNKLSYNLASF